jgi:hypothetical protein
MNFSSIESGTNTDVKVSPSWINSYAQRQGRIIDLQAEIAK